jgi:hypothetical protein
MAEQAPIQAAYAAEVAKLGAAGPQRVDAVVQWLNAYGGEDAGPLANMFKIAPVASTIKAIEHIMRRVSSQGAAPGSAAHRENAPSQPSDATWNGWTMGQKQNWQHTGNPSDASWATTEGSRAMHPRGRG